MGALSSSAVGLRTTFDSCPVLGWTQAAFSFVGLLFSAGLLVIMTVELS